MKFSSNTLSTSYPSSVGTKLFPFRVTYSLSFKVLIIAAYVDGLPIPSDSNFLIRDDSVSLAGGFVKSSLIFNFTSFNLSSFWIFGKSPKGISSSSLNSL